MDSNAAGVQSSDPRRQFITFACVGVAGLVVDVSVLHVTQLLGMDRYSGRVCSYLFAATTTWALNRRFTFGAHRSANKLAEWARFLSANLVGGAINYAVYAGLVSWTALVATYPSLGVCAGSIAGLTANFTLSRKLVFNKRASAQH
jgi:putative flippase GtrA